MEHLENFSWVVEKKIAGCKLPKEEQLGSIVEKGFRTLVTLRETSFQHAKTLQEAGINCIHLPITDYSAPTMEQMAQLATLVEEAQANVRQDFFPALFHCQAGIGRTGTMLAVALFTIWRTERNEQLEGVNNGKEAAKRVITSLRAIRKGALEVEQQEAAFVEFVSKYYK